MGRIYCLMGKSSTGKDTIYKELLGQEKLNLQKIVPYTTRPIREGEKNGEEYFFTDEEGIRKLEEENRIIVKYGLNMIENTNRVGLAALIDASSNKTDGRHNDRYDRNKRRRKTKITSSFIGFTLAPRINAAGRVRSASIAVELFLSEKYSEAAKIADQLCQANKERQAEENKIMQEAYDKIEALDIKNNPVIVLDADDWHHGVIGIVSSRITEKYSRPSILVSFEGNDEDEGR